MVKNGIPPNAKLPTFVTDKIEKQAKEMKKKRGAMIVMGEESGDESDGSDTSANGHAFVATCIVINEDGVAYLDDGEEGDDEDDDDETHQHDHCAKGVQEDSAQAGCGAGNIMNIAVQNETHES